MASTQIVQTPAMPPQKIIPINPPGASSIITAGYLNQQNQNKLQNQLGAGKKRRRKSRGGAAVQVPPVSSSAPNPQLTGQNYTDLTKLASTSQSNAQYDNLAQNGGTKRNNSYYKRGGNWPKWACLSGGKKTKRSKSKRNKSKRNKSKRNKSKRRY
jgi:hypothetical protein